MLFIFDNKIDCAIFQFETDTLPWIELRHMIVNNLFDVHRKFRLFFLLIYNLIKIVCEVLHSPLFEGDSLGSIYGTLDFWDFTRSVFNYIVWWEYLIIIAPYYFFHIMWKTKGTFLWFHFSIMKFDYSNASLHLLQNIISLKLLLKFVTISFSRIFKVNII